MKRRDLLRASGAGSVIGLAGCTDVLSKSTRLEVSIYLTETLAEEYTVTESYTSALSSALNHSLTSLPSVETVELSIVTDQQIPDPDELTEQYQLDLLDSWREEFRENINPMTQSKDSNILLTPDSYNSRGKGSIPTQITQSRDIGYISNGRDLLERTSFLSVDQELILNVGGPFGPLIHEIGHNVGLIHSMGRIYETNMGELISTPMIGITYFPNFQGRNNYYGTKIPDSISVSDLRLSSTFNSEISESDVHLK